MDEINAFFDFSKDFQRQTVPRGCISGNLWATGGKLSESKPAKRERIGDDYANEMKLQEEKRMMDIGGDAMMTDDEGAHSSRYGGGGGRAPSTIMDDVEDFSENDGDEEEPDIKPKINRIDDGVYDKFPFNLERDDTLPIHDTKDDIVDLIRKNPVVVLEGDTGCGKTTQINDGTVESTSLCEDSVALAVVTNDVTTAGCSTAKHIPKRMTLLDGIFFKYVPENSTSNKVVATCVRCLPRNVEVKGYNNCTSNFISHLKRKHGDGAVKEYKNYLQQMKKSRNEQNRQTKISTLVSGSFNKGELATEIMANDYRIYSNNFPQIGKSSLEKPSNTISSMSESESCNSNFITQSPPRNPQSQEHFDEDVVKFFIHSMIPLRVIENPYFINIFKRMDNAAPLGLRVMSRQRLKQKINEDYEQQLHKMKETLKNANCICVTTENWSECRKSLMVATAHWIDERQLQRMSLVLCCARLKRAPKSLVAIKRFRDDIQNKFELQPKKILATIEVKSINYKKAFQLIGVKPQVLETHGIHTDDANAAVIDGNLNDIDTDDYDDTDTDTEVTKTFHKFEHKGRETDYAFGFHSTEPFNAHDSDGKHFLLSCIAFKLSACGAAVTQKMLENNACLATMHDAVLSKCNALWILSMQPKTAALMQHILGQTLKRPLSTKWNSLYDAFKQLVDTKEKYAVLHNSLGLENPLNDSDFQYIKEHLICAEPMAEALNILQTENESSRFYGIVMPCLLALRRRLRKLQKIQFYYCLELASIYLQSVEEKFKSFFEFSTLEAENAAVAALSYPRFKNKWFTCLNAEVLAKIEATFKTIIANEIENSPHFQNKYANMQKRGKEEKEFFVFVSDSDEEDDPSKQRQMSPSQSTAELLIRRFYDEDSEDLELLHRYPEIRKVFIKYNIFFPAAVASRAEDMFSAANFLHLPKSNKLASNDMIEKCLILKANTK